MQRKPFKKKNHRNVFALLRETSYFFAALAFFFELPTGRAI
jgi:hypothetical protein